ncbi:von Hippel-Lindau disease tumour suppressor beta/alpha domain [Klebsormidium nitens]|uniref:von Hippel-Lindau disease tumour suppressor beta/alpha domain n=1 Tax=Klebsormidium nitens TaxID=105231 RepID=A0A1Y1IHV8_KLENI|nr:von Hippel-Lindau disease tumour suppressor beta/alpha domain [Klebsormidium nitens]|eukprot:GAQ89089.1 von Hippel-Lindau disease tumour suppressor beta/alpha domain [Klebsormidium nitens]
MQGGTPMAASSSDAEAILTIKSLRSKVTAWVRFTNMTKDYVSIFWLNYGGEKILYHNLKPQSKSYWQHTFESHPWIACKFTTGELLAIDKRLVHIPTGSAPQKVDIQEPASLPWSQGTHSRYPSSFKSTVRTLLLAHNRAWSQQPQPQGAPSLRRSARLAAKRMRKESNPLGVSLAGLPPELLFRIVPFMAPAGVLDLEHVPGEESLPGYDALKMPQ